MKIDFNIKDIPTEDLEKEYLRRYSEDITATDVPPEIADKIFADLGSAEMFDTLLKSILKADRVRYFNAAPDQQGMVRGAFMRTLYLLKKGREATGRVPVKTHAVRKPRASFYR